MISLETEPPEDVGEEGLLVIFSTQASQTTSTWSRCGWSRPNIEMYYLTPPLRAKCKSDLFPYRPACEVTVLTIKVNFNGTECAGIQGPIQWFVEDQSVRYRYGMNDRKPILLWNCFSQLILPASHSCQAPGEGPSARYNIGHAGRGKAIRPCSQCS